MLYFFSLGVFKLLETVLRSAAAGFAFGEAASFAVESSLMKDVLLKTAARAAARAGSTGVTVVTACLVFTSALLSLGAGFLLAATVMKLMLKAGLGSAWLTEATAGASVVAGAVTTGVLVGVLPPWIYIAGQGALVLFIYSCSNVNDMTIALLIIFTTLYLSVVYGQMGAILGLFFLILTIGALYALRKTITSSVAQAPNTGSKLLERIFFYCVFVGILGFSVGLGTGKAGDGLETEVVLMLNSVLWVAFLSAGLLGAGLGTVAMVGLGTEVAGKISIAASVTISLALRAILESPLKPRSATAAALGAAAAAGVSLGAASVAAKQTFDSRNSTLIILGSVVAGTLVALKGVALKTTLLTASDLVTVALIAVAAFSLGATKSPFHTKVNLQRGHLTGTELIKGIGMETVTAAAAPIGAGALGAAALGTAALGTLGTIGVLVAITLALGSALSGMIGKAETSNSHRD